MHKIQFLYDLRRIVLSKKEFLHYSVIFAIPIDTGI